MQFSRQQYAVKNGIFVLSNLCDNSDLANQKTAMLETAHQEVSILQIVRWGKLLSCQFLDRKQKNLRQHIRNCQLGDCTIGSCNLANITTADLYLANGAIAKHYLADCTIGNFYRANCTIRNSQHATCKLNGSILIGRQDAAIYCTLLDAKFLQWSFRRFIHEKCLGNLFLVLLLFF